MRVAYLVGRFPVLSETFVAGEIREMERLGHEVGVYALDRGEPAAEGLRAGVRASVTVLGDQRRLGVMGRVVTFTLRHPIRFGRGLLASLRDGGPGEARAFVRLLPWALDPGLARADAIHAHFAGLPTRAAHLLARATGRPFGFTAHARDIFPIPEDLARRVRDARWVVTVCEYNRRAMVDGVPALTTQGVRLVPCGVDVERFRRTTDYRARPLRVVAVGRLVEKKGFDHLIEAARLLAERACPFEMVIVGDGPLADALASSIAAAGLGDRVRLRGAASHAEVVGEIEASTVLVQPSVIASDGDRDSMPVVLKEAMSLEVPVVGTTVTGLPEAIGEDAGWLVPPSDPGALADVLEAICAMAPDEIRAIGRRARARVEARFRIDRLTAQLAEVLSGAVAGDCP